MNALTTPKISPTTSRVTILSAFVSPPTSTPSISTVATQMATALTTTLIRNWTTRASCHVSVSCRNAGYPTARQAVTGPPIRRAREDAADAGEGRTSEHDPAVAEEGAADLVEGARQRREGVR